MRVLVLAALVCVAPSALAADPQWTLEAALKAAMERSPDLAVAEQRIVVARAELATVGPALPNPSLELEAGPRLGHDATALALDATFMQPLNLSGVRGARRRAGNAAIAAAEAARDALRWRIHADVHAAWDDAVIAGERERLFTEAERFQRELREVTRKRAKAGEDAPITTRLADVEVEEAQQATIGARAEVEDARFRLAELVGTTADDAPSPTGLATLPKVPELATLVAFARARDYELVALNAGVAASRARIAVADSEGAVIPVVGVGIRHEGGLGVEPAVTAIVGVVSIPLPFSAENPGAVQKARAEAELAASEVAAAERRLEARVARARAAVIAADKRVTSFGETIVPRFAENLTLIQKAYAVGEMSLADALLARERFLRAQLDALGAKAAVLHARAELERLIGADLEEVTP